MADTTKYSLMTWPLMIPQNGRATDIEETVRLAGEGVVPIMELFIRMQRDGYAGIFQK